MTNRKIRNGHKLDFISIIEQLEDRVLFHGVPDATFVLPENLVDDLPEVMDSQMVATASQNVPIELVIAHGGVEISDQLIRSILEASPDRSFAGLNGRIRRRSIR